MMMHTLFLCFQRGLLELPLPLQQGVELLPRQPSPKVVAHLAHRIGPARSGQAARALCPPSTGGLCCWGLERKVHYCYVNLAGG